MVQGRKKKKFSADLSVKTIKRKRKETKASNFRSAPDLLWEMFFLQPGEMCSFEERVVPAKHSTSGSEQQSDISP